MRLHHAGAQCLGFRICLKGFGFGERLVRIDDTVCPVDLFGDDLNAFAKGHIVIVEELEIAFVFAGFHDDASQLLGAFAPLEPMFGECNPRSIVFCDLADAGNFVGRVGIEAVDADNGTHTALENSLDVCDQVRTPLFDEFDVLLGVGLGEWRAWFDRRAAAVHLQGPHGGHDHDRIWLQSRLTTLEIPELLKPNVGSESTFGNVIVRKLCAHEVCNDRILSNGNIGEGSGMDEHRLTF